MSELGYIGSIYACIAGDHRYGTSIKVYGNAKRLEVRLMSTAPLGGIDGPGGTYEAEHKVLRAWDFTQPLTNAQSALFAARDLLTYLKRAFKEVDSGTVAQYGKPTKNFKWVTDGGTVYGFNTKIAATAIQVCALGSVPA